MFFSLFQFNGGRGYAIGGKYNTYQYGCLRLDSSGKTGYYWDPPSGTTNCTMTINGKFYPEYKYTKKSPSGTIFNMGPLLGIS
jgi:hypothetical protein